MSNDFRHLPRFTFVLGGAASGKSRFAETLAQDASARRMYIATAQAFDDEMKTKIHRHQARRTQGWRTVEAPLDASTALAQAAPEDVVLFDCASLWLSNHMFAESDLETETFDLIRAITTCNAPVIVVSNEVGQGVVPDNALARAFRQAQGELNQKLAAASDLAVFVTAGLPQVLKGTLP